MRFDDRLATLLMQPAADAAAKAALWTQIADIMTQESLRLTPGQRDAGLERLRLWRDVVPIERRRAAATALSWHAMPADMINLFADEPPGIAAPALARAQLADEEWVRLIPGWPSTSRALLRERRDLGPETSRLLAAYGTNDFALPGEAGDAQAVGSAIQIRDLVARIEAYRRDHHLSKAAHRQSATIHGFRFESGDDAIVNWVEGAPRGALIGISLADMAEPGGFGVDGHAAGACRQRMLFRDAHLMVAGAGEVSGAWFISAIPLFNPEDGRFLGYRGVARRPDPSPAAAPQLLGSGLSADSVRQLAHELRTPLNAIRGFGQMIEGQFFGPVARGYSDIARHIVSDAARLMVVIDDLDSAARLETGAWSEEGSPGAGTDLAEILGTVANELRPWSDDRAVHLRVRIAHDLPKAQIDGPTGARIMNRMLSAAIGLADKHEELCAYLEGRASGIEFHVDRPASLAGFSREQISTAVLVADHAELDPPPLGLGFAMRLVEAMARAAGGHFEIGPERFSLILPNVGDTAEESKGSG